MRGLLLGYSSGWTSSEGHKFEKAGYLMLVIMGIVGGAIWGGFLARRRKGNRLDILQYAAASAIAFGLVGLFATILVSRLLG